MEVIRIAGYTEDEKVEIARRHLIPNQLTAHGLEEGEWELDDDALKELIRRYTREAGVRNLEREIAKLARKCVTEILKNGKEKVSVKPAGPAQRARSWSVSLLASPAAVRGGQPRQELEIVHLQLTCSQCSHVLLFDAKAIGIAV